MFRQGLRAALEATDGIEVVGEAVDGREAVALCSELDPDVVLMDVQMPGLNGVEATRMIVDDKPDIRVLVLTMFDNDSSVFAAVRAGAKGYLLKGSDQRDVERAIRSVAAGEAVFGSGSRADSATTSIPADSKYFQSSLGVSTRCSSSSPPVTTTRQLRPGWASASRPCATTSRTSLPSYASPIARTRSSRRARRGSAPDAGQAVTRVSRECLLSTPIEDRSMAEGCSSAIATPTLSSAEPQCRFLDRPPSP